MRSLASLLLLASLLIAGARSRVYSARDVVGDVNSHRVNRQPSSCVNYHCKALLNRIKLERRFTRIRSETSCQNNVCEDVLDVHYSDGTRSAYECSRNGCQERGSSSGSMESSPTRTSDGYGSTVGQRESKPEPAGSGQSTLDRTQSSQNSYTSTVGQRVSKPERVGSGQSAFYQTQSSQNSYTSTVGQMGSKPELAGSGHSAFDQTQSSQNSWSYTSTGGSGYSYSSGNPQTQSYGTDNACQSHHCRELVNKMKLDGKHSSINVDSSYVNGQCADTVSVMFINGAQKIYECNTQGCALRGSGQSKFDQTQSSQNSYTSTVGQRGSKPELAGSGQSAFDQTQSSQNSWSYTSSGGSGYSYSSGNPQTQSYGTGNACQSHHCRELVNKIKLDGKHSSINVDSSCVNGQCADTISVMFINGTQQIYDCNTQGCALRGKKPIAVPDASKTVDINTTDYISRCSTVSCKDLINKLKSEVVYSSYYVSTSCNNTICEDTITILYRDDTQDVFICVEDGCNMKATPQPTPAPAVRPTEPTTITTTRRPSTEHFNPDNSDAENSSANIDTMDDISTTTPTPTPTESMTVIKESTTTSTTTTQFPRTPSPTQATTVINEPTTTRQPTTSTTTTAIPPTPSPTTTSTRNPTDSVLCPALKSDTMEVKCRLEHREVDCLESVKPGTRAEFECRPSHSQFEYQRALYATGIVCQEDGRWSHAVPECKPGLGLVTHDMFKSNPI